MAFYLLLFSMIQHTITIFKVNYHLLDLFFWWAIFGFSKNLEMMFTKHGLAFCILSVSLQPKEHTKSEIKKMKQKRALTKF